MNAAAEQRVQALLKRMTLEEKVGQVIQGDIDSLTPDDVRTYHLGSVLNGGSSGPYHDDLSPAAKWLELADEFYNASVDTRGNRTANPSDLGHGCRARSQQHHGRDDLPRITSGSARCAIPS